MDTHAHDWDKLAPRLLSKEREKSENPAFLKNIFKGERKRVIADFGCGPGYYSLTLKRFASRLYCIDSNKNMLAMARNRVKGSHVVFLEENSAKTSLSSSSIDVLFMANSFHDMDREGTSKEARRILKAEGKIIIVDWKKESPTMNKNNSRMGPPCELRMSETDYIEWFKEFKVRMRFDVGPNHFGMVLSK